VILQTRAARLLSGAAPFVLGAALIVGAAVIGGATTNFNKAAWQLRAMYSAGGALVVVVITVLVLRAIAAGAMRSVWTPFQADLAAIRGAKERAEREGAAQREATLAKLLAKEQAEEADAHAKYDAPIAEIPRALERRTKRARDAAEAEQSAARAERKARLAAADNALADRLDAIDEAAQRLLENNRIFEKTDDASRAATKEDQLLVDFIGRVGGTAFDGGTAKDFEVAMDSAGFIPGFIEQMHGSKAGDKLTVKVKFPDEYGNADLAGKDAEFEVDVKEVRLPKAATLDDASPIGISM
jgi:FKBP-type peptidyl-prolyl cis-trans isomerase